MLLFEKVKKNRTRTLLMKKLSTKDCAYIMENYSKFCCLDQNEIAQTFIAHGFISHVVQYPNIFNTLNDLTIKELAANGLELQPQLPAVAEHEIELDDVDLNLELLAVEERSNFSIR